MLTRQIFALLTTVAVAVTAFEHSAAATEPRVVTSIDWPSYNNDAGSNRYSPATQMTAANVATLHAVCSTPLGAQQRFETGPIVVAGILYATALATTYAINAATCKTVWTNTYVLPAGAGGTSRGAAYANGRIYRGYVDGHVVAIDAATGKTVWNRSIIAAGSRENIVAAPVVSTTAVYIGTAGGDNGQPCRVVALSLTTGNPVWSGQTVPNLTDPLASTWKGAVHIAGGSTWTSYSLSGSGKLYVPVGNPGPDFDVRKRAGANAYTNSLIEIDAASGKLTRSIQFDPEDAHDWDTSAAPALVTLAGGTTVALAAGKDGYLRSVDLTTFRQNWQTAVTTIANATAPIAVTGTHFCPGTDGGVVWNGAAYSPVTGDAYVGSVDWCRTVDLAATPQPYVAGKSWLGSSNSYGTPDASDTGWLYAVDASTGAVKWRYHSSTPLVAGVTPTAGGLVFTADLHGNVLAFDATSGKLLKSVATGAAIGGGVVSYETGGKQYLAVAAGMYSSVFKTPQVNSSIVVLSL